MSIHVKRLPWLIREPSFYQKLIFLALPMAGQNIISYFVGLADNIMVAQLGDSAVGGVFVFNQVQNILSMLVMGLGSALVILASQYYGKKDMLSVKTICAIGLRIALAVGLGMLLLMLFLGQNIFSLLAPEASVVDQALSYAQYMVWSFLFFCVTNVMLAALRSVGTVHLGLIVSSIAVILDIGLNYLLIFGRFGFPAMGVAGAGLATLISRVVECAVVLSYLLLRDQKLHIRFQDMLLRSPQLTRDFVIYGFPIVLGDIFWGFGGAAQTAIIGRMGPSIIAASAMAANIYQIFTVLVYGFASAGAILVGQQIGRNDFAQAKRFTKTLQLLYICVGLVSSLALLAAHSFILGLYSKMEAETLVYASQFLTVMCFMLIGTSYQMSSLQIVRAGGATHFVLVNDLIFVWLVVIPLSCLAAFVFHAPPWVVYLCLKCDQILKCAVAAVKVNRFRWMKNLTHQRNAPMDETGDGPDTLPV